MSESNKNFPVASETPHPEAIVTADIYDTATNDGEWDSPERAQRLVEKYVGEGTTVLDIGIGTGQAVKGYAEMGATIIGLDHDPEMLRIAQEVTGNSGHMQTADINKRLPLEGLENKIDVAQAIGVLEFASNLEGVVDQVKSALRPGGVFVFTVETPADDGKTMEHFEGAGITVYRHRADEVRNLLMQKELSLLYDEGYGGYDRGDNEKVPYHIFLAQKTREAALYAALFLKISA